MLPLDADKSRLLTGVRRHDSCLTQGGGRMHPEDTPDLKRLAQDLECEVSLAEQETRL